MLYSVQTNYTRNTNREKNFSDTFEEAIKKIVTLSKVKGFVNKKEDLRTFYIVPTLPKYPSYVIKVNTDFTAIVFIYDNVDKYTKILAVNLVSKQFKVFENLEVVKYIYQIMVGKVMVEEKYKPLSHYGVIAIEKGNVKKLVFEEYEELIMKALNWLDKKGFFAMFKIPSSLQYTIVVKTMKNEQIGGKMDVNIHRSILEVNSNCVVKNYELLALTIAHEISHAMYFNYLVSVKGTPTQMEFIKESNSLVKELYMKGEGNLRKIKQMQGLGRNEKEYWLSVDEVFARSMETIFVHEINPNLLTDNNYFALKFMDVAEQKELMDFRLKHNLFIPKK